VELRTVLNVAMKKKESLLPGFEIRLSN
jgi:hypothetical protein